MAEQQQDVDALKRKGRRRLVGAVALVLLAVIVLPMVLDPEPRRTVPPVSVRIPGEDETAFTPQKPTPEPAKPQPPQETTAGAKPPPAASTERSPSATTESKPTDSPAKSPTRAKSERARAEAALSGTEYVVPVGAYQSAEKVVATLKGANIPHYTEPAPGNLTRVRAGPFATKEAAEKAVDRLKALGLKPGRATSRTE